MQSTGGDGGGFRGQWRALPPWLRAAISIAVGLIVVVAAVLGAVAASHQGRHVASTSSSSTDTTETTLPLIPLGGGPTTAPEATSAPTTTTATTSPTTTTAFSATTTTGAATTVPGRTTTTSTRPVPGDFCAARMSDPLPPEPRATSTGTDTVQVSSNLGRARVVVTAHYATGPSTSTGSTDARGSASIPLTFDRTQAPRGFTVVVDVSVANGAATCQTSFTTQ